MFGWAGMRSEAGRVSLGTTPVPGSSRPGQAAQTRGVKGSVPATNVTSPKPLCWLR